MEEVSTKRLIEGALRGMVESLDIHIPAYLMLMNIGNLRPALVEPWRCGCVITAKEGYVTVVAPIKVLRANGWATAGDRILKVDEKDVRGLDGGCASRLILGEPGTQVVLEVERDNEKLSFTITREFIEVNPVEA